MIKLTDLQLKNNSSWPIVVLLLGGKWAMMGNEFGLTTNYMCTEGRLQQVWIIFHLCKISMKKIIYLRD